MEVTWGSQGFCEGRTVRAVRRAIHIHSGRTTVGDAVDAWLDRHGVERMCCADAFAACSVILMQSTRVPDLAFVGADRLASDELPILAYLREAWPGVGIVLYGRHAQPCSHTRATQTLVCPSSAALREIMDAPPDHLLVRLRRTLPPPDRDGKPRAKPVGGGPTRSRLRTAGRPVGSDSEPQTDSVRPGHARRLADSAGSHLPVLHGPRSTLTPEELSILLEDTHD
jgi:hypothetical protein